MRLKLDDIVEVLAGDDRGVRGKVLKVDHQARKVLVEGVNRVYKHVRASRQNPQGGRLSKEMPVCRSNVAVVCEKCNAATRLGARFLDDGSKERYCKKCGAGLGVISPAKAAHAKS